MFTVNAPVLVFSVTLSAAVCSRLLLVSQHCYSLVRCGTLSKQIYLSTVPIISNHFYFEYFHFGIFVLLCFNLEARIELFTTLHLCDHLNYHLF